ncbi:hypothetical protein ACHAXS_007056 [Conticribra weissflogii]
MTSNLPKAVVKTTSMSGNPQMQESVISHAQRAIAKNYSDKDIAAEIRQAFQKSHPTVTWHCFVGRDFGLGISHMEGHYIYFYISQRGVCLFATP